MRLVLLALLLAACRVDAPAKDDTADTDTAGLDDTGDTDTDTDVGDDADADGYTAADGDCDDTNAAVNPGAAEVCNDVDDDCDASIDELATDAGRWYDDDDGDGYGVETIVTCDQPEGSSTQGGDCDDGNAAIHPGADELCDGVDGDCDGEIDEDAVDVVTWYDDADLDGYGDPVSNVVACDAPVGHVADGTDCDPADPSVNPGAAEVCDPDDRDEDCDGAADDTDPGGAGGASLVYADTDGDGYGDAAAGLTVCDVPDGWLADASDCDDTRATAYPGAPETCGDGLDDDCDGVDAECPVE